MDRMPGSGHRNLSYPATGPGVQAQRVGRVWASIGWAGVPSQPGTAPSAPRWARSNSEVSQTMTSSSPRIQVTGGSTGSVCRSSMRKCVGARQLRTPRVPGATPGQVSHTRLSPG